MRRSICGIILILLVLATLGAVFFVFFRFEIACYQYRDVVNQAARQYGLPPRLLASLIWQETRFVPLRRGKAGEIGLTQIRPASAREWAKAQRIQPFHPADLFDPGTNTMAGAWYLARAMARWKSRPDPVPYALAEYNAGASNAQRWDREAQLASIDFVQAITYPSTRRYVLDIMSRQDNFGKPWRYWRLR
jgi:soluble lytic murein transglycosylase